MSRLLISITCILFSVVNVWGQGWQSQFDRLVRTPPGPERDSLIARIVSESPDWREVLNEIGLITFPGTVKGKALLDSTTCVDGVTRPYVIYVPSGYDPKTPAPMLIHLHGLVNRPTIDPDPGQYVGNNAIMAVAEKRGWLVLFPFGQKGAAWWDEVGMTNIMTLVRMAKINFNVDDDRVYLSGLSDGASAAFLFAMIMPTDFAAFAALNGSMGVGSEDGNLPTYAPNMANTNIFVTTADRDRFYPTSEMERTIAMAETAGARIMYRRLTGEHISSIQEFDYSALFDYLEQHPRNTMSDTITWETATAGFGVCKWLAIDEITTDEPADWYVDYNVALVDSSIAIGFQLVDTFPGPGIMVAYVANGDYVANRIGLKSGDVIINGNGVAIDSLADLENFKATLKRGSEVALKVRRAGGEVMLRGRVPAPRNYFIFRREQPSAVARAIYKDNRFDIQGSRVGAFRILINPKMIDLNRNVIVVFNGMKIYDGKISPDIGYAIRDFLDNRDRKLIFVNELSLRPSR